MGKQVHTCRTCAVRAPPAVVIIQIKVKVSQKPRAPAAGQQAGCRGPRGQVDPARCVQASAQANRADFGGYISRLVSADLIVLCEGEQAEIR